MAIERALAALAIVACNSAPPPQNVTLAPVSSAPSMPDASADADAPSYAMNARTALDVAERIAQSGRIAEARVAFEEVVQRYPYSRLARDAELRIAELDEKSGNAEKAAEEFRTWAHNHPSDERAAAILARAETVGDTTCRTDADCAIANRRDCCDCCPNGPYATSRTWLSWRDAQCSRTQCVACPKKCAPFDITVHAVCRANSCVPAP